MTIAGIGAITGYGWGRERLWDGLLSGKSAAALQSGYGPVRDEDAWVSLVPEGGDPGLRTSRYGRAVHEAAREAVADARDRGWRPGRTVGLLHAIVLGDVVDWREFYLADEGYRRSRDYLRLLPSTPVSMLMQEFGFHGPAMNVSAACSSANVALITAKLWLDAGMADDVIFVATDLSATPEMVEHFVRLGAAVADAEPMDACRPFQEGSRGFSMGEASVAFVLTRRAERPYAAVLGGAMSNDAYHVVSVDPTHEQILDCVRRALADAGVAAADVSYFNAHGTGTRQCDVAEHHLLERLFADRPHIYALKPLAGHCQGAAAAVEVAAAALGYDRGIVPAAPIVAPAHPRLLDGPAVFEGGITAKLSLGMGGNNSVVVLGAA
ncbi:MULTISPECIES: beta-ketoacyl synthase N-terminal-like domain-containing protein [Nocardia]|uniref:beta-ketoacyl synthase N-terminal-like domain-containing protein n=1 Tax=Nocardia TaxID=1817 RepID=UPI00237E02C1|nr:MULTISPECIES: beta-ketoacyl synthase N-terminal-like domain-containing protein [Nocardia]MDE1671308.1 beta-ketoacyl synthase N-terminal-like domain-containing protein [Nocardia gipuzkoensis]